MAAPAPMTTFEQHVRRGAQLESDLARATNMLDQAMTERQEAKDAAQQAQQAYSRLREQQSHDTKKLLEERERAGRMERQYEENMAEWSRKLEDKAEAMERLEVQVHKVTHQDDAVLRARVGDEIEKPLLARIHQLEVEKQSMQEGASASNSAAQQARVELDCVSKRLSERNKMATHELDAVREALTRQVGSLTQRVAEMNADLEKARAIDRQLNVELLKTKHHDRLLLDLREAHAEELRRANADMSERDVKLRALRNERDGLASSVTKAEGELCRALDAKSATEARAAKATTRLDEQLKEAGDAAEHARADGEQAVQEAERRHEKGRSTDASRIKELEETARAAREELERTTTGAEAHQYELEESLQNEKEERIRMTEECNREKERRLAAERQCKELEGANQELVRTQEAAVQAQTDAESELKSETDARTHLETELRGVRESLKTATEKGAAQDAVVDSQRQQLERRQQKLKLCVEQLNAARRDAEEAQDMVRSKSLELQRALDSHSDERKSLKAKTRSQRERMLETIRDLSRQVQMKQDQMLALGRSGIDQESIVV